MTNMIGERTAILTSIISMFCTWFTSVVSLVTREAVLGTEKPRLIYGEAKALPQPDEAPAEVFGTDALADAPTAG